MSDIWNILKDAARVVFNPLDTLYRIAELERGVALLREDREVLSQTLARAEARIARLDGMLVNSIDVSNRTRTTARVERDLLMDTFVVRVGHAVRRIPSHEVLEPEEHETRLARIRLNIAERRAATEARIAPGEFVLTPEQTRALIREARDTVNVRAHVTHGVLNNALNSDTMRGDRALNSMADPSTDRLHFNGTEAEDL